MKFRYPLLMIFLMACLIGLLILTASLAQPVQAGVRLAPDSYTFNRGWLLYNDEMTQDPNLAIDPAGGRHVVFSTLLAGSGSIYPVYYGYCANDCTTQANWTFLILGDMDTFGGSLNLALTPGGKPRVIWENYNLAGRTKLWFAECNTNCTLPASWSTGLLWEKYSYSDNQHYLRIDPNGVAHFIYEDDYNEPHNGAFYASCANNCTDPASWTEGLISTGQMNDPDLHFDSNGNPGMLFFDGYDMDEGNLFYAECEADCENGDNWYALQIAVLANWDPFYSLELTSSGEPRVAFFTDKALYYAWCNTGCTESLDHWTITSLGLPEDYGYWADLELDGNDRPHLAYHAFAVNEDDGLHYAVCTAGCESANPTWEIQPVELDTDLNASDPFPVPPQCMVAFWSEVGVNVSFDLDADAKPHFAYGAEAHGFCNGSETMITKGLRFAEVGSGSPPPTDPVPTDPVPTDPVPTPDPGLPKVFLPFVMR